MNRQDFLDLQNISKFYQYLALGNTIKFNNGLTNLVLRMDDNFNVMFKNLSYPEIEEQSYNDMLFPAQLLGIISVLKNTIEEDGQSAWDRINVYVAATISLNTFNEVRREF